MARSGLAKGANKGHITETRERAARPSRSKGVSSWVMRVWRWEVVTLGVQPIRNECYGQIRSLPIGTRLSVVCWSVMFVWSSNSRSPSNSNASFSLSPNFCRDSASALPSAEKSPVRLLASLLMSAEFLIWSKPEVPLLIKEFTNLPRGVLEATSVLFRRGRILKLLTRRWGPSRLEHKHGFDYKYE